MGGDDRMIESAKAGDPEALDAILARYQPQIYRFGMKMCRDPEDAADVLQNTLLAVARTVKDFRGASSMTTWLYTIARSFCIKQRRKQMNAEPLDGPGAATAIADPAPNPEETAGQRQIARVLDEAIHRLEPKYREVLVLRDVEGLTAPEVAEVLGVSVAAVKSRLHRARKSVRAEVAPLLIHDVEAPRDDCPDVLDLYSKHTEGEISRALCDEMEQHLASCDRCASTCDSMKQTLAMCRASPAPIPPEAVQARVRRGLAALLSQI